MLSEKLKLIQLRALKIERITHSQKKKEKKEIEDRKNNPSKKKRKKKRKDRITLVKVVLMFV